MLLKLFKVFELSIFHLLKESANDVSKFGLDGWVLVALSHRAGFVLNFDTGFAFIVLLHAFFDRVFLAELFALAVLDFNLIFIDGGRDEFVVLEQIDHFLESMVLFKTDLASVPPIDRQVQLHRCA